ncbi:MAG: hypothetical protein WBR13_00545 [Allosphingosinicella sp.]
MPEEPPLEYPPPTEPIRQAALRLMARLDDVRLHQAAAYVRLAVEAMAQDPAPAVNDNKARPDSECAFELDDYDRVWMIRDGDCHLIGNKDYMRTEMWRFLRTMLSKPF